MIIYLTFYDVLKKSNHTNFNSKSVTTSNLNGKVSIVYSCSSNSTSLCGFMSGSTRRSTRCCYTNDCNTIENGLVSSCYTGVSSRSTKKVTIEQCPPGLGHQCVVICLKK